MPIWFLPNSSTSDALLYSTHDWQKQIDNRVKTAAVFFDLSKAFDKVSHPKLINALHEFGIAGPLLKWFFSYVSNRFQRAVLNRKPANPCLVSSSAIPQGSILSLLLFCIFMNSLTIDSLTKIHFSPGTKIILYADDIVLYKPSIY